MAILHVVAAVEADAELGTGGGTVVSASYCPEHCLGRHGRWQRLVDRLLRREIITCNRERTVVPFGRGGGTRERTVA